MFSLNIKPQYIPARYFSFCVLLTVLLVTLSIRSLQGELFITDAQYMGLNGLSKEYILMSIKPHYADLIYTERKRFEYRKRAPKLVDLPILLYETAPVQKVTGIIADWSILQASPEAVWTYSKTHSGLTADRFFGYYEGYDKAVAIRIYSVVPFKDSLELQTLNPELKRPPQSFCYVQSELDLPMKG